MPFFRHQSATLSVFRTPQMVVHAQFMNRLVAAPPRAPRMAEAMAMMIFIKMLQVVLSVSFMVALSF